jgi:hypothetical protein
MAKRFTLPDSHAFFIKALPGVEFTVNFSAMDNESMLSGVVRGLKNIMGDAVGGSEKSADEKLKLATEKLESFVAGTIGDGKSLSPFETEMRKNLSAWLQARKWKQSAADKYAREGDGVFAQFKSLCEKNSIDWTAGQKVYDSWSSIAVDILKRRAEAASLVAAIAPPADESAETNAA